MENDTRKVVLIAFRPFRAWFLHRGIKLSGSVERLIAYSPGKMKNIERDKARFLKLSKAHPGLSAGGNSIVEFCSISLRLSINWIAICCREHR